MTQQEYLRDRVERGLPIECGACLFFVVEHGTAENGFCEYEPPPLVDVDGDRGGRARCTQKLQLCGQFIARE